jgi:hypothetical protein
MEKQNGGDAQRTRFQHETESPPSLSALGIGGAASRRRGGAGGP